MPTPMQKCALDKLIRRWTVPSYMSGETEHGTHVTICALFAPQMTKAQAASIKGWLMEQGLQEAPRHEGMGKVMPGQFEMQEVGTGVLIIKGNEEHFPQPEGDIQKYWITLHTDDFVRLSVDFSEEGWFTVHSSQRHAAGPQLGILGL